MILRTIPFTEGIAIPDVPAFATRK
jgi:hypothetical protein